MHETYAYNELIDTLWNVNLFQDALLLHLDQN